MTFLFLLMGILFKQNVVRDLGHFHSSASQFYETVSHNISRPRYRTDINPGNNSFTDIRCKLFIAIFRPLLEFHTF